MALFLAGPVARGMHYATRNGISRTTRLTLLNLLLVFVAYAPSIRALPTLRSPLEYAIAEKDEGKPADDPTLWAYLGTAVALVILGGIFAGLTIALMGQDELYLQVIATSGDGTEKKSAKSVLRLLKKGKHWVLVTLLLSNVITNETLPIVLDRSLGGGWPAVLSSTVLIVIFGEIVPQSICVRYGLPIGAWMSPMVLALMWIMAPVAWPTAKLLDYLLGEDHGTTYKKAGLKTLVTLHKTLGTSPDERLNQDEVTIISAVLDLKDKPIGDIMTPMGDVFTMSADTVLDVDMMDTILSAGYSRIPIYQPDNPRNFIGMLLVKMLITYDPEDALRVRDFALATLPETRPETSCLDIVNFFQEGKSHMVLVSDFPGEPYGALGVVTLEDVIEELIGEEIIDESDVFVDVHKAIRRMHPAPRTRVPKGEIIQDPSTATEVTPEGGEQPGTPARRASHDANGSRKQSTTEHSSSPKPTTFMLRRRSSGTDRSLKPQAMRSNTDELRQHLKHLGPSNVASRPKSTRISTVRIKPGQGVPDTIPEGPAAKTDGQKPRQNSESAVKGSPSDRLVTPGKEASDGVQAVAVGYGTMGRSSPVAGRSEASPSKSAAAIQTEMQAPNGANESPNPQGEEGIDDTPASPHAQPEKIILGIDGRPQTARQETDGSEDTVGSLNSDAPDQGVKKRKTKVRSGSITANITDVGGVRKMILETNSSSDTENAQQQGGSEGSDGKENTDGQAEDKKGKKKRKKRAGKKRKGEEGTAEESAPLLETGSTSHG
ncbi:cell agglutination protein Mam3 [Coniosporium apollinis]|uniref:Cell agglutination protein Mam3 n=1 Tax=Coniosporium apollinis TaxID=61459 RepID=A0ABQ9NKT6_9PEZI|nr:cell agglutination protein Mam3 [Coniosporium apollinis]